jgi:hypothetical protein
MGSVGLRAVKFLSTRPKPPSCICQKYDKKIVSLFGETAQKIYGTSQIFTGMQVRSI